jgi:hypothetical protein
MIKYKDIDKYLGNSVVRVPGILPELPKLILSNQNCYPNLESGTSSSGNSGTGNEYRIICPGLLSPCLTFFYIEITIPGTTLTSGRFGSCLDSFFFEF